MTWDGNESSKLKAARLLVAPPDFVYQELKNYGEHKLNEVSFYGGYEEMEKTLLTRDNPLINLGLAQFSYCPDVVLELYKRGCLSSDTTNGSIYNQGLRVACFSNQSLDSYYGWDWLEKINLKEVFNRNMEEEAFCFLNNPNIPSKLLTALYNRTEPYSDLDEDSWLKLIYWSRNNKRLNSREDTENGPDLNHWDIHKAILNLIETAPLTKHAIKSIYWLLINLDPSHVARPENIDHILDRWNGVEVKDFKGYEDEEGHFTILPLKEEFRCLIASLYGSRLSSQKPAKIEILGSIDANDIALRSAYYGNADMKLEDMATGYQLDEDLFVFSALNNDNLFHDKSRRALLEEYIRGDLIFCYQRRCDQIHKKYKKFDPRPIFDFDNLPQKTEDVIIQETIAKQVVELVLRVKRLEFMFFWVFVGIAALILLLR